MFDYSKLKGRMKEKNYTQEDIANELGLNKSTINLRLNNQSLFVQDERNKRLFFYRKSLNNLNKNL